MIWHPTQRAFGAAGATVAAIDNPFQDAHVLAKSRPQKLAVVILAEPVHRKYPWRMLDLAADLEPMIEVIADVVATERQHGKGITPHLADFVCRGSRCLGAHGRRHVDAVDPVEAFRHKGGSVASSAAKDECRNRHALGFFPIGVD